MEKKKPRQHSIGREKKKKDWGKTYEHRDTARQTDRQTGRQTDRQTDRQADRTGPVLIWALLPIANLLLQLPVRAQTHDRNSR